MKLQLSVFIEHYELAVDRAVGKFSKISRYLGEELVNSYRGRTSLTAPGYGSMFRALYMLHRRCGKLVKLAPRAP
jgi:hypothetical protein